MSHSRTVEFRSKLNKEKMVTDAINLTTVTSRLLQVTLKIIW